MSGENYDHIQYKDVSGLMDNLHNIQKMADNLAKLGYASDAAKETQDLLLTLRQFENRINTMQERLFPVWEGIALWESSKIGEDDFNENLKEYRDYPLSKRNGLSAKEK